LVWNHDKSKLPLKIEDNADISQVNHRASNMHIIIHTTHRSYKSLTNHLAKTNPNVRDIFTERRMNSPSSIGERSLGS
jgi:hypothetical protein